MHILSIVAYLFNCSDLWRTSDFLFFEISLFSTMEIPINARRTGRFLCFWSPNFFEISFIVLDDERVRTLAYNLTTTAKVTRRLEFHFCLETCGFHLRFEDTGTMGTEALMLMPPVPQSAARLPIKAVHTALNDAEHTD